MSTLLPASMHAIVHSSCEQCDWAIVSYANASSAIRAQTSEIAKQNNVSIALLQDGLLESKAPKVLYWPRFQASLMAYDYIWLLDEGMR
jgi:hypothetical protein